MEIDNEIPHKVYVVMYDAAKDLSDAKRFGELEAVFLRPIYDDDKIDPVERARSALKHYEDGDYILMIGDPMLCGVVTSVALEYSNTERLNVLRWDRRSMSYKPMSLNFT
jgi:hypothetical protein